MALFPLSFPSKAVAREKLSLNWRTAAMESPHTFAFQGVNTAAQWMLEFNWPRMTHAKAQELQAWLDSLRGQVGTFRYQPRTSVGSALTGKTLPVTAYNYSQTISIGGWTANQVSGLFIGQFFSLGDQLLRITTAPANADATGKVTVEFSPMLRKDYAAGTAVNFATPSGVFRLTSSEVPSYTLDYDRRPEFPSIIAKEAIG